MTKLGHAVVLLWTWEPPTNCLILKWQLLISQNSNISAIFRPYLIFILAISRQYQDNNLAISWSYVNYFSAIFWPYLNHTLDISQPYPGHTRCNSKSLPLSRIFAWKFMSKFGASGGGWGGWGTSLGTKATQLHNILVLYFNISANLLKEKDGYVALEQSNSRSFVFK